MSAGQTNVLDARSEVPEDSQVRARIGNQILRALGEPAGLRRVHVQRLWEHHFRANVLVGKDTVTTRIAHSFFVVADAAGTILSCDPSVRREYENGI